MTINRLSLAIALGLFAGATIIQAADLTGAAADAMKQQAVDQAVDAGADMAKEQAKGAMGMDQEEEAAAVSGDEADKATEATK